MKLKKDKRNELFKRREIEFLTEADGNPGFELSKQLISENLKVNKENIVIKSLKNNFGANEFLIEALIYDSKEHMDRIESRVGMKDKAKAG